MRFTFFKNTLFLIVLATFSCGSQSQEAKERDKVIHDMIPLDSVGRKSSTDRKIPAVADIITGAEQASDYLPLLRNKQVAVVANQTSILSEEGEQIHLVDFLIDQGIHLKKVFAPEHGFRGTADAGELVKDGIDTKTGLPLISLHGKHKKPTDLQLKDVDVLMFDIQDVGVRFYTYISTLHYVMEACAEAGKQLIILDRPNPNGHYVDGPTMLKENTSFLGMHPIPLVHGMTIGEYAQMINGEGWLAGNIECDIRVIKLKNYTRHTPYSLPVRPSPNLPNDTAINLYPSLGLLEGTNLNAGRGTEMQFQVFGSPYLPSEKYTFTYTPQPNFGSKNPKFNAVKCNGLDLRDTGRLAGVNLSWIIAAYHDYTKKSEFFNRANFTAHAGTPLLQQQIENGLSFKEIKDSWENDLKAFRKTREKYLLYN